jgi:hypothetical protein
MATKSLTTSVLAAAAVFGCTVNGYSASASPTKFEERKAQHLQRLESRIARMQEQKSCIATATTDEALKSCQERSRPNKGARQR